MPQRPLAPDIDMLGWPLELSWCRRRSALGLASRPGVDIPCTRIVACRLACAPPSSAFGGPSWADAGRGLPDGGAQRTDRDMDTALSSPPAPHVAFVQVGLVVVALVMVRSRG